MISNTIRVFQIVLFGIIPTLILFIYMAVCAEDLNFLVFAA